jgi:hypothetical protein
MLAVLVCEKKSNFYISYKSVNDFFTPPSPMPIHVLWVKATLEGVATMQASDSTSWVLDISSTDESDQREGVRAPTLDALFDP